jgi:hypothetical protein
VTYFVINRHTAFQTIIHRKHWSLPLQLKRYILNLISHQSPFPYVYWHIQYNYLQILFCLLIYIQFSLYSTHSPTESLPIVTCSSLCASVITIADHWRRTSYLKKLLKVNLIAKQKKIVLPRLHIYDFIPFQELNKS